MKQRQQGYWLWMILGLMANSSFVLAAEKASTDAQQKAHFIIQQADRVRAPSQPFRYTLTLVEHRDGKAIEQSRQVLDIAMKFAKPNQAHPQGELKALIRFVAPARDKGKALLADLDKMWYYSPDLRRPIPISKQQRLVGQVANGDVVAADFDTSYAPKLLGEEPCGNKICYKLSLTRLWPSITYPVITYWVEKESYYPYRADFFAEAGLLLKRSYYQDYQPILERMRPTQIVVQDALRKEVYTTMQYSDVQLKTLADFYFQKEYLPRLN